MIELNEVNDLINLIGKKIIRKNDFKVFRVYELRINTDSLELNYFLDEYDRGTLGGSFEGIKSILKNYKVVE